MSKHRAAIYCRVSTRDQTLDQQKSVLICKCTEEGWDYAIYEEVMSGAKRTRPILDQMMTDIRQGKLSILLVQKLDRLGRSLAHLIQIVEELNNKGVQFICMSPNIDTKSASGRFFMQIIGAVAELERELIRERTISKLNYLKSKGVKLGRPKGSKDKKKRRKSGYYLRWSSS